MRAQWRTRTAVEEFGHARKPWMSWPRMGRRGYKMRRYSISTELVPLLARKLRRTNKGTAVATAVVPTGCVAGIRRCVLALTTVVVTVNRLMMIACAVTGFGSRSSPTATAVLPPMRMMPAAAEPHVDQQNKGRDLRDHAVQVRLQLRVAMRTINSGRFSRPSLQWCEGTWDTCFQTR
jgi:hypothetical protein